MSHFYRYCRDWGMVVLSAQTLIQAELAASTLKGVGHGGAANSTLLGV